MGYTQRFIFHPYTVYWGILNSLYYTTILYTGVYSIPYITPLYCILGYMYSIVYITPMYCILEYTQFFILHPYIVYWSLLSSLYYTPILILGYTQFFILHLYTVYRGILNSLYFTPILYTGLYLIL